MSEELTPWEDINPPMVSVQRHAQESRSSALDEARIVFRNELVACLALTAPAGMTEENRRDWLAVAWDTLKHLPPDILASGARAARLKCDHPSKIVPSIIEETRDSLRLRREYAPEPLQIAGPAPAYCSPEDARQILSEFGLKRNPLAIDE